MKLIEPATTAATATLCRRGRCPESETESERQDQASAAGCYISSHGVRVLALFFAPLLLSGPSYRSRRPGAAAFLQIRSVSHKVYVAGGSPESSPVSISWSICCNACALLSMMRRSLTVAEAGCAVVRTACS